MEEDRRGRGPDRRKRKPRAGGIRSLEVEPQVRECLEKGGTLMEASRIVADNTGYFPNKSVLSRYWQSIRAELEGVRQLEALVSAVLRGQGGEPGCDVAVLARKLLMIRALDAVRRLPEGAFEEMAPDRISLVVARLERAGAAADGRRLAARRLELQHRPPEPPEEANKKRLASLAAIEALSREFLLKERAEKAAAQERAGEGEARP